MSNYEFIKTERDGNLFILTLNRPDVMNACHSPMHEEMQTAFNEFAADDDLWVAIVTGAGDRAFSAGNDLKYQAAGGKRWKVDTGFGGITSRFDLFKPVIAAVNGVAITGGFELALACDILIASETARFADTHQRVGVIPGWGLSQKLSRIIGPSRAKEMAFSGRFVSARQASDWGLVSRAVPAGELMADVMALAQEIAEVDAGFLADYKRLVDVGYGLPFGEATALESEWSRRHNAAVKPDELEARRAGVQAKGRSREA
jgi:enoyl-CoA hydratase